MSTPESVSFTVTGIKAGTCVACEKETQVFDVLFRQQAMALCPQDFFKQVKIAVAAAASVPPQRGPRSAE
jgi:hypothetical protein